MSLPKRKAFLAVFCAFFVNLRSVDALRSLYDVLCEFFLNEPRGGAQQNRTAISEHQTTPTSETTPIFETPF